MLTLPASHSRAELELARRIAERLGSGELHVFWTACPARTPAEPQEVRLLRTTLAAIGAFFGTLTSTLANLGRTAARS